MTTIYKPEVQLPDPNDGYPSSYGFGSVLFTNADECVRYGVMKADTTNSKSNKFTAKARPIAVFETAQEAINFETEQERVKILAKLTPEERKILGV